MLWVKSFHVVFVVSWYAGLLYLPRLFVYHAMTEDESGHQRFVVMERKLLGLMAIAGIGTAVLGFWLVLDYAWQAYSGSGWLHAKLALVAGLYAYHGWCVKLARDFREHRNHRSHRFYRVINEIPALILIAVVVLVIVKPF
ncbi:MAG: CopD family protein [Ectothiorhodospiraceae bacterium]|nr:CopD family protein [Chromatiales bacterium]MCP5153488.1 CopD family protein [Ectothiorhodospiraceae bacterium]